jgi:hypothetical protein
MERRFQAGLIGRIQHELISGLQSCRPSSPVLICCEASIVGLRVQVPDWLHARVEHPYDLDEAWPNYAVE